MAEETSVLRVGIDLGTSRSAISASDGSRHVVDSFVGWPVDMVAQKVLKRDVLIGREALDNREMLDLHRPLEQGLIKEGSEKDETAVRELLKHLLSLVNGKGTKRKVYAVVGVPAEALRVNKQSVRNSLEGLVDGVMVVSEPFAVAYGLDELLHTMIIDIGAGTSDFCVMRGRYPTEADQRTLTDAGDWVDEQLHRLIRERHPGAKLSLHMAREWKEKHGFVGNSKSPVKVTVPVGGKPTEIDITEELKAACEALVPPVAESMVDLIARVDAEYQKRVRDNIILCGGCSQIAGLGQALHKSLGDFGGGRVRVIKDPLYAGSDGGLAIAKDAPDADWDKLTA